jgi:L-lactate dehydrogenase complex protein LldE
MNANIFVTCLADTFYPGFARAAVGLLERFGMKVACPPGQTCCGQPMFNAGYFGEARAVAARFLDVFEGTTGPIVAPSSSCAAMVRTHYARLFRDAPEQLERAREVGERTFELCEFLVRELDVDLAAEGAFFEGSVTFHRSCHYRRLGISEEPIDLIRQIAGLRYLPLDGIDECCGFGGTFSVNFPEVSGAMAAAKLERIERTGADWLIVADPGCAMNITGYANRVGRPLPVLHVAELIERALGGGGQ